MALLVKSVDHIEQIVSVKKLLEVYMVIKNYKYRDMDLNVLGYYCLFGPNPGTDKLIKAKCMGHISIEQQFKVIHNIRYKLKKLGILIQNPWTLTLSVHEELATVFADQAEGGARLGAMLNFTYHELERDSANALG